VRFLWAVVVALVAAALLPAAAAARTAVPGEVIVRFAPGAARADVRADARVNVVRASQLPGVQLVKVRSGQTVAAAVKELERRPGVRFAEPNYTYRASATEPDDYDAGQLWGLATIDAPDAWDLTHGSDSVQVAVVDTGIAYDHDDLAGNMWTNPGEIAANATDDDGNGFVDDVHGYDFVGAGDADPRDVNGHGSHVAGTIGAVGDNTNGVTGVNWDVALMAVRVLGAAGFGSTLDIAEGFDYAADNGARVVNASLGGGGNSHTLELAIANHPDTLFVVAAGNESTNNDVTPSYPCNYPELNLICVAATTQPDGLAGFSNTGATSVDLGAPGTAILSSIPHMVPSLSENFDTNPGARWSSGGTSQWQWVLAGSDGLVDDSPSGDYAADTNSWLATASPIAGSGIGCSVLFDGFIDTEEGYDALFLETSPDGITWTPQDLWTGSFSGWQESGFDGQGGDLRMRFRLEADDTIEADGAALDDISVDCIQGGASNDYDTFSGTSMATPHVAGVAALALALRPDLTVGRLRDALLSSGDPLSALNAKTVTGRRLNARAALNPPPSRTPTTLAATVLSASQARLSGTVNPLGTATSYQFEIGTTTAYGAASPVASAGSSVGARAVSETVGGLAAGTTYHYRIVWRRGDERAFGADRTFTTAAAPTPQPPAPQPPAPRLADVTAAGCTHKGRRKRARLRCALEHTEALASARLTLKKGKKTIARRTLRPSRSGTLTLKLKHKLRKGRYVVRLTLRDAGGNTRPLRIRFRVR
jgi:subtilisin family serine protease